MEKIYGPQQTSTTTANGLSLNLGQKQVVTADPDHNSIGWKLLSSNPQLSYDQGQKVERLKELAAEMINVLEEYSNTLENKTYLNASLRTSTIMSILDAQMKAVKYLTFKY